MNFDDLESTGTTSLPRRHGVTLTFDLQNPMRSSIADNEYSVSVLPKLFKTLMRYRGKVTRWVWTNKEKGLSQNNAIRRHRRLTKA